MNCYIYFQKEPPEEMITKVAVPDVSKIQFLPIRPSNNLTPEAANKNEKFPLANIPFRFTLDDIQTNFVQVCMNYFSEELQFVDRLGLVFFLFPKITFLKNFSL